MSFKRTTPTVVLNDTGSPQETTCTVDPLKPNLTRRFLRSLRTPYKQTQTQGPKLYSTAFNLALSKSIDLLELTLSIFSLRATSSVCAWEFQLINISKKIKWFNVFIKKSSFVSHENILTVTCCPNNDSNGRWRRTMMLNGYTTMNCRVKWHWMTAKIQKVICSLSS